MNKIYIFYKITKTKSKQEEEDGVGMMIAGVGGGPKWRT